MGTLGWALWGGYFGVGTLGWALWALWGEEFIVHSTLEHLGFFHVWNCGAHQRHWPKADVEDWIRS